jgi:hypothetical protein
MRKVRVLGLVGAAAWLLLGAAGIAASASDLPVPGGASSSSESAQPASASVHSCWSA